jgi:hypothetical protein
MNVRGQLHIPATLPLWKKLWYALNKKLHGLQSWSGDFGGETNLLPLLGFIL